MDVVRTELWPLKRPFQHVLHLRTQVPKEYFTPSIPAHLFSKGFSPATTLSAQHQHTTNSATVQQFHQKKRAFTLFKHGC